MLVIHGTAAFRAKVTGPAASGTVSTTALGAWYANLVRRRSPRVLIVNERTLLPVVLPLAPARTFLARLPDAAAEVMAALAIPDSFVSQELALMREARIAPTANRSVVGILNDMGRMLDRWHLEDDDLLDISLSLADRPTGRLRYTAPNDELRAVVDGLGHPTPRRASADRHRPVPSSPTSPFPASVTTEDGRTIEIRHRPGLADELMQELKPLLAADGIDLDDPDGAPELATLQAAMDRAVERRNLELFTPVGPRRVAAAAFLLLFAAALADDRDGLARGLLSQVEPEARRPDVAEVSAVIGMALSLLDDWLGGQPAGAPTNLQAIVQLPREWRRTARPAAEILALATRGRAFSSLHALIVRQGGEQVLAGAAVAIAAAADAWARTTGVPIGTLLPRVVR